MVVNRIGNTENIRYIERIMRNANAQYPRISPYRVSMYISAKNLTPKLENWVYKIGKILDNFRETSFGLTLTEVFANDVRGLKYNRLGDCGESSALSMSALLANGNIDGRIARLMIDAKAKSIRTGEILEERSFDTTHECVLLNLSEKAEPHNPKTYGKNVIVMDAWAGFCSNLSEAFRKYFDLFLDGTYKHIDEENNAILSYKPRFIILENREPYTPEIVSKFQNMFPELIIKKK